MFEKAKKFIRLADAAKAVCDSDADWETKYDLIFSEEISVAVRATGVSFDPCDPDTSYQEDVLAYVEALVDKANELRKAFLDEGNQ
jgi:adenosine deaminase